MVIFITTFEVVINLIGQTVTAIIATRSQCSVRLLKERYIGTLVPSAS